MIQRIIKIDEEKCDGGGLCAPACPTGAINVEERETVPYDKAAVMTSMDEVAKAPLPCGCPGSNARTIERAVDDALEAAHEPAKHMGSRLRQWPVQINLVPANAPYFEGAHLLIAADCVAYAYGNFHNEFMRNKITIIGCPKLDAADYSEKFTAILRANNIKSITVVRMEVPCCSGIEKAIKTALSTSGKVIPWQVVTITTDGRIQEN